MLSSRVLLLVALTGCRQIFGFEGVTETDAAGPPDVFVPDASACTTVGPSCATPDVLRTCTALGEQPTDTICSWGCLDDTIPPHCGALQPSVLALGSDNFLPSMALIDQVIANNATIDTTTGSINGGVRPGGTGVINGIDFGVVGGLAIFRFKSVVFQGTVTATGNNPLVIVADGAIEVRSVLDLRGGCSGTNAGPGGNAGGSSRTNGSGPGRGIAGDNIAGQEASGGGGAGHGVAGAPGGDSTNANGGAAGPAYGDQIISILAGGSGGGGGARAGDGGAGGGGGGAVYVGSNTSIVIGNAATGGINAGGCGGTKGAGGNGAGGGGGSGGAIVLEAPVVTVIGGLAVNGGGGGAGVGAAPTDGEDGKLAITPAAGGSNVLGSSGGAGGAGDVPGGAPGGNGPQAGGGGGAAGRIRINTRSGMVTIMPGGFTSPTIAPTGPASTGTATVD